ncbi:hypothetical protein [Nocardia vaccinii]|uniref:hypothetical protein n=1 Tax=Nocardia vaccinii TaxID=1822 RepID=UPI000837503D|nr:hypothetical protein [Nocardia vaccinii]
MLISEEAAQAAKRVAEAVNSRIARVARADVEHCLAPAIRETDDVARVLPEADSEGLRTGLDAGEPSFPPLPADSAPPDRFYNGARLWQVDQVFPRAFPGKQAVEAEGDGYIRTASHSSAGDVVYLTDSDDIAGVYGTITSWTDVRDGTMRFHPAGMVLGVDANRIAVNPMAAEGHSAANFVEGVSDRVFTTPGRVDTSKLVSVRFQTYDNIIGNPDVTLVADGFPGFEGLGQESLRDRTVVADRLAAIADVVRRNYPTIDVSVGGNPLSSDEAITTFLAT